MDILEKAREFRRLTEQELIDSGMTVGQMQIIWDMVEMTEGENL